MIWNDDVVLSRYKNWKFGSIKIIDVTILHTLQYDQLYKLKKEKEIIKENVQNLDRNCLNFI